MKKLVDRLLQMEWTEVKIGKNLEGVSHRQRVVLGKVWGAVTLVLEKYVAAVERYNSGDDATSKAIYTLLEGVVRDTDLIEVPEDQTVQSNEVLVSN